MRTLGFALPLFLWLLWLSRGAGEGRLSLADGARILLLGMFGYYLSSLFDFYGLEYISAGLERLILFTYPTLILLFQVVIGNSVSPPPAIALLRANLPEWVPTRLAKAA